MHGRRRRKVKCWIARFHIIRRVFFVQYHGDDQENIYAQSKSVFIWSIAKHMAQIGLKYYALYINYPWVKPSSTLATRRFLEDCEPNLSCKTLLALKTLILKRCKGIKPYLQCNLSDMIFESIPSWEDALKLSNKILPYTSTFPSKY